MHINDRIQKLRSHMAEKNIDVYMIPSSDNHQSEYVGAYFKAREFITGFTGSAGTAIITQSEAGLWTDGRYFIQAEHELAGSEVTLYRAGDPGVPTIPEYLETALPEGGTFGFDGRVVSMEEGKRYETLFAHKQIAIACEEDLIHPIWEQRPAMAAEPVFLLEECYSGESTASKLTRLREAMTQHGATAHILATLDDIAWLLNIRGRDVDCSPLILSYAVITLEHVHLFINKEKLNDTVQKVLQKDGIVFHPYNDVYAFVAALPAKDTLLIDPSGLNYALYHSIPSAVSVVEADAPTILFKSIKNEVEIANLRNSHIKDAIAHTKFMYWLKTNLETETITEIGASDQLESFRKEQEGYLWPSFEPISAYGEHAAMCHYSSTEETNCALKPGTLYLSDTGGNYYEGSTDITRTYALGEISDELKLHFTSVVRCMINLAKANFLYGCTGHNLDILARQPLWDLGLDFKHGTGHGVGYLLNIHEGPCGFRWRIPGSKIQPLEKGMVITDEPGLYIAGSHGIRIENELVVQQGQLTEYGQFMYFEPITLVPIDLDAINPDLMLDAEKAYLNEYHQKVYETISPHLTCEEQDWLRHYTRAI